MSGLIDFRFILNVLSRILFILTGTMIMSAGVAVVYSESLKPFIKCCNLLLLLSIPLFFCTRRSINHEDLHQRKAYLPCYRTIPSCGTITKTNNLNYNTKSHTISNAAYAFLLLLTTY
jgi:hypothetical protein